MKEHSTEEKIYITNIGFKRLQKEYRALRYEERPKILDVISWAASNGDRSENGDYIYGKKRLREIDRRLRYLSKQLNNAVVVDPVEVSSNTVAFGATVVIEDEDGNSKTYAIVGSDESDPKHGWISYKSPLARALYKATVGDCVSYQTPKGERFVEIIDLSYQALQTPTGET